ncbi:MAG: PDZ domain-containing protein [Bacteroidales bacterium]|nr:PDZ domain-containing protein [Bacteroidales bacterium]
MSNKNTPLYIVTAMAIGVLIGSIFSPKKKESSPALFSSERKALSEKTADVLSLIDSYYFDSVDGDSLLDISLAAMLQGLDPHSSYISARDAQQYNSVLTGEFEGIGISFNVLNDTIVVISVNAGGPSQKSGLLPGDKIIRVDTGNVAGVNIQNTEIISRLRGPKGTKVRVEISRAGVSHPLSFEIIRDKIPIHSVEVAYMLRPKIGYIQIENFSNNTGREFDAALQKLLSQGMEKLVLDLRGNSGGSLQTAVEVCDELLQNRKMIVYTLGKSTGKQLFRASSYGRFQDEGQEVVVLIDEWSASAAEIVAGAVQDQDRGIIIGRRSFGKGLVQRSFTLKDSSEILLTVARYYTPTGRCIQKPFEDYDEEIVNRYLHGEMSHSDSIPIADSLKFKTPKGKTVYGGGGIIPDLFVPVDTSSDYIYFNQISRTGILFKRAISFTDKNRESLTKYRSIEQFNSQFSVPDSEIEAMIGEGEEKGIGCQTLTSGAKIEMKKWFKAYVARNLFGENGFYYLINRDDKVVQKALEILEKSSIK